MITSDCTPEVRIAAAQFHKCLLELFSTNSIDRWFLQLRHEEHGILGFLLNTDQFYALCVGLKQCIDATLEANDHQGADMMVNTIAQDLPTTTSHLGGISIISTWRKEKTIQFNIYRNQNDRESRITLIYMLEDAMSLSNMFSTAYNKRSRA